MDALLARVTQHAVQYAIRSGISITAGYAIKEAGKLLQRAPESKEREQLRQLNARLDDKVRIISPSIDFIELIAARGNTSLASALSLSKSLRRDIHVLAMQLATAAEGQTALQTHSLDRTANELRPIIEAIQQLLARIEDAVPLINLAITTSGVSLSTQLARTVSPSRLLQASSLLTSADSKFASAPDCREQVGPAYMMRLYMLFDAHAALLDQERQPIWKEVVRKARIKLWRVPLQQLYALPGCSTGRDSRTSSDAIPAAAKAGEFAYQLVLVEDCDDGLYHEPEEYSHLDDVEHAGLRDVVPVHEISKIFYADTGKILGIGNEEHAPVLLLKRDVHAEPPRRMMRRTPSYVGLNDNTSVSSPDLHWEPEESAAQPQEHFHTNSTSAHLEQRLPADLDPEWLALEVYVDTQAELQSDDDSIDNSVVGPVEDPADQLPTPPVGEDDSLVRAFSVLNTKASASPAAGQLENGLFVDTEMLRLSPSKRVGQVKTNLSLLEMLLKLTALQQFRQDSHLAIEDELLVFFLENNASAEIGADKNHHRQLRREAAKRVGFDPYDESPLKAQRDERSQKRWDERARGSLPHFGHEHEDANDREVSVPRLEHPPSSSEEALSLEG